MDIGDLGFLIIAFIVFIVNFIVKSNKEKAEAQSAENQKTAEAKLPEPWEEELTLPPLYDPPFISEKEIEQNRKHSKSFAPTLESIKSMENRIQPAQKGMSSMAESLFKEDDMESISYQDEDTEGETSYTGELFHGNITEELKKGIIYSEILHRKYE